MSDLIRACMIDGEDWPQNAEDKYERIEILGKGSFGMVWMARRRGKPSKHDDDSFDEFVAVKNIQIKNEKGNVYAEREISILEELRHPNVIRLIQSYPMHQNSRIVVMQLARGPNLHQIVVRRGALGMPLARLVCRQLVAAVSYLHGRACIHRDIKPSNCILASEMRQGGSFFDEEYDWYNDSDIWDSGPDGERAVKENKWKLMLVDFGFSRALEKEEIVGQTKHLRNSIVFENEGATRTSLAFPNINDRSLENDQDETDDEVDEERLGKIAEEAARSLRNVAFQATSEEEDAIMGAADRKRESGVSKQLDSDELSEAAKLRTSIRTSLRSSVKRTSMRKSASATNATSATTSSATPPLGSTRRNSRAEMGSRNGSARLRQRKSQARTNVRSMSALGTKAYAAPEIRKQLRHKTEADFNKDNAAMTECVADYGMIVDSYSVGWTLRVAMTGVPPSFTLSEYMRDRDTVVLEGDTSAQQVPSGGCCCGPPPTVVVTIRDPTMIPDDATLLIKQMTEKKPEDRITVREAQQSAWIAGGPGETPYKLPQGDYPSKHGDPVVPLRCAPALTKLTRNYHESEIHNS